MHSWSCVAIVEMNDYFEGGIRRKFKLGSFLHPPPCPPHKVLHILIAMKSSKVQNQVV